MSPKKLYSSFLPKCHKITLTGFFILFMGLTYFVVIYKHPLQQPDRNSNLVLLDTIEPAEARYNEPSVRSSRKSDRNSIKSADGSYSTATDKDYSDTADKSASKTAFGSYNRNDDQSFNETSEHYFNQLVGVYSSKNAKKDPIIEIKKYRRSGNRRSGKKFSFGLGDRGPSETPAINSIETASKSFGESAKISARTPDAGTIFGGPADTILSRPAAKSSVTFPEDTSKRIPDNRSLALPLRGPGDSLLPFQDKSVPKIEKIPSEFKTERAMDESEAQSLKKILLWNDAYGDKSFGVGFGREPFIRAKCKVDTCLTTGIRDMYKPQEIDAILWHFRARDLSLPKKRSSHTRYVFWMMESASYLYNDISRYNRVFNWTFTYRLDSDFPDTYNLIHRLREPLPPTDYTNVTINKTKKIAWFVSHCFTVGMRERFVHELQKVIPVDVYGECGPLTCNRRDQWAVCYKMLERDYKFYLSFENSLCKDYVTEKFFDILKFNVVPVVFGLGNYSALAPPHSYIDALDFVSPQALANYLLYLDQNHTAYMEYFQWKSYHEFPAKWDKAMKHYCDLCERLHTDDTAKSYDLRKWFVAESNCQGWNPHRPIIR